MAAFKEDMRIKWKVIKPDTNICRRFLQCLTFIISRHNPVLSPIFLLGFDVAVLVLIKNVESTCQGKLSFDFACGF